MSEPIDFYFDFTSPYAYLMSEQIDTLAERFGRKVRWHPVLLGLVFKHTGAEPPVGIPLKGDYLKRDFERSARFLGVPMHLPANFPVATQAAGRTYYWLHDQDCALARRFAHAVFRAYFVEGADISAPEAVVGLAAGLGVDGSALASALKDEAVKARLKTETEAAMARGVFGAPLVFIDGEPFWGADRLGQIERWLAEGGF
jgi:2-hydroxychromene-2-carboxylate isomerase